MKNMMLIISIIIGYCFANTGILADKNYSAFGIWAKVSRQIDCDDCEETKEVSLDYMTKVGLEIGLNAGQVGDIDIAGAHLSYHFKSNSLYDKGTNFYIGYAMEELSLEDQKSGLSRMSIDITKALFRKLATKGEVFSEESFRTIKASYYRIALDFIETYRNDAIMNGLTIDIHQEEKAVEMFAKNIMDAGKLFLDSPMQTPFIPSWNRVQRAVPDIFERLYQAVEEDHLAFSMQ